MQQKKYSWFFSHCDRWIKQSPSLILGLMLFGIPVMANEARSQSDRELPITVAACSVGGDTRGAWWFSMNTAGNAVVVIDSWPKMRRLEFTVPREKIVALRQAISEEKYFELKEDYGEEIIHGSLRILTIMEGEQYKTVRIRYLMDWIDSAAFKLKEPARALRIFMVIRRWFEDSEAFDLIKYDQKVLDTVEQIERLRSQQITNQTAITDHNIQGSGKTNDLGPVEKRKNEIE